ncbi:TVP38/TMEM64 family protein [Jeotgalibacillus soli]|uniref:TVP38/TMEM64 family membrane protein n=1 Tax=Jeotgalibacillus soli TaxID=889306 RepID=A0A0C2S623_9BACL|nr:VTT domain-containing protein [Jeotgalibacillus soli]KIL49484.1 hypothetical protein KP78_09520 [Jeotgalibacillus soli]
MQSYLESILSTPPEIAIPLSILVNIAISILGFIPSAAVTAVNLAVFGFWGGMLISFAGESLGAIVSFSLYRKGFHRFVNNKAANYPRVQRLLHAEGKEAFLMVLSLRLLPFVPSSTVSLFAAVGKISFLHFAIASTLGKIPALVIEVYSTYQIMNWTAPGQIIASVLVILLLLIAVRNWNRIKK